MEPPTVVAILDELLACERRALAPRLFESTLFVSRLAMADWQLAQRMARATDEHCALLTELILELGGTPGPRRHDLSTADLHYQELHHVLPRLIADHEALVRKYRIAGQRVGSDPPGAAEGIRRILRRHQEELDELRRLRDDRTTKAASC